MKELDQSSSKSHMAERSIQLLPFCCSLFRETPTDWRTLAILCIHDTHCVHLVRQGPTIKLPFRLEDFLVSVKPSRGYPPLLSKLPLLDTIFPFLDGSFSVILKLSYMRL